jgi:hypothetical protein
MLDENSPEVRLALAPYEDLTAQHNARMAEIGEEFAREMREYEKEAAERDRLAAEELAAKGDQIKADREAGPPEGWVPPREIKDRTMRFGEFEDEEQVPASTWTTPTPPMGFPPAPPIPEPMPETPRITAHQPVMSFGDFEDEDAAPQPPPTPPRSGGRRRLRDDDDEDMSGQSWLS